jgi:nucleoside permease NupC
LNQLQPRTETILKMVQGGAQIIFGDIEAKKFTDLLYYEVLHLEVSGGPFVTSQSIKDHIEEDRRRLAKFSKDGWDFIYYKIYDRTDADNMKLIMNILNQIKFICIHIFGM